MIMNENNTENNTQQPAAIAINAQFVKDISFEAVSYTHLTLPTTPYV